MAVDLYGIRYTVEYWNVSTLSLAVHDVASGVNLNNEYKVDEDKECALIHVQPAANGASLTDLFMLIEGPSRTTNMYDIVGGPVEGGETITLEDALKVYVKLDETNTLWAKIGLIFPEDLGLPNNVPVDEAIFKLSDPSLRFTTLLDTSLSFEQEVAILVFTGISSAADAGGVDGNDNAGTISELTSTDNLKRTVTKAAVAGSIFNSFEDCATQSAYGFLFDCLANLKSAAQGDIDRISAEIMGVISGINNQIDAAIDLIQTAAILPLTQGLKSFLDPLVSNGKYLAGAYSKFMAKVDGVVGSLPLGMLVDIGKCMAKDPEIAPMLRMKDHILGVAKDGLIYDEALNLLDNGYPEVGAIRHSILALTSTRGALFRGPTAKLIWGSAMPKYIEVLGATSSRDVYMSALNALPAENRLMWYSVSSVMQKHTTVQTQDQFNSLKDSIVLPDYISWDCLDDSVSYDGTTSITLSPITAMLMEIYINIIDIAAIEYVIGDLEQQAIQYTSALEYAEIAYDDALILYTEAVTARTDAIAAGTDSGDITTPLYIAEQEAYTALESAEWTKDTKDLNLVNTTALVEDAKGIHAQVYYILGLAAARDSK